MKQAWKKLGKMILAAAMAVMSFGLPVSTGTIKAAEAAWQLSGASFDKIEGNDVYLNFASGQKARITFLNEDVLRVDVEMQDAEFEEYPEPMASTHTTTITAKSEKEYDEEYQTEVTVSGQQDGDTIEISPVDSDVTLRINKETAKMSLVKGEDTLWQETESLHYDGTETVQTLATESDEYFYGGGQQNGFFSHKNRKILIENKSTWVSGGVSSPNPFYISSYGYGVLRNTFQPGSYDFSATAKLEHDENRFDAYYFIGDMKDVLGDYVELTGNPMLMPKYGFYQGNADCYNGEGEELLVDGIARAKMYGAYDMPVGWFLPNDGYGCGYGKSTDADENIENLRQFVDQAKELGFMSGLWTENDLDKLDREVANGGTSMIKTDVAWVGDGYSFGLNAVRQAFEGIENNSENRGFIISLDGWAGTQRYAGLWSGDQTGGNWEYIRFHIPTYIGAGLSGNPNVGSDLDGIYGSDKIISTRDFQWKSFTPIEINMDGWTTGGEKNPWFHGEPYTSINRMYLKMKSAFMPYNYSYAKEAHDSGVPMIRALVLEYPNDPFTWGNQTQYEYLWGENLLVAPLYQDTQADAEGNDVRNNIYLPDSEQIWIDYFTGEQYQGGQVINNFDAPLWKLPLFVKNGAILPKDVENNSQLSLNGDEDRIFEVYPAGETSFDMYDDDGITQEYKEGKGATTHITSKAPAAGEKGTAILTVEKTVGDFTGMKKERATQFIVNVSEKPEALTATIGGEEVQLTEVTSKEELENGENVFFYDETPNLNHYASEGSVFADVEIITTPKLRVRLGKADITTAEVQLCVEGFVNAQETKIDENDPELSEADVPTLSAEASDNSITLSWDMDEDVSYGLIIDGQSDAVYRNVTAPFVHDSLNAGEEHTYQLIVYNTKYEVRGEVQRFATEEDRYKNVIEGMTADASSQYGGNVGGYPASNAVDGDESSLWYTDWDDPIAYAGTKTITIDLQDAYYLDQLEYFNNGTAQIRDHEIQVSLDNIHFKTVEKSVWEKSAEFRVFVDLEGVAARYVRIVSYDPHHNSANEFRVYKQDGTSAFNPASTKGNMEIKDDDITFLENYMGVTAGNATLWAQVQSGDFNYNNEIDAYDLAFTMAQLGLENTGKKAAGAIAWSLDKTELKKGETAEIKLDGKSLKDTYAFGMRFPFGDVIEKVKIEMVPSAATEAMMDLSKQPQSSTDYVVALSHKGNAEALQGDVALGTIKITALEDVTLALDQVNAIVVSTGLDTRLAIAGDEAPADVAQLENVIAAAKTLNISAYKADSLSAYEEALEKAEAVLNNADATQTEMNTAIVDLITSLDGITLGDKTHADVLRIMVDIISEEGPNAGYTQADLDKLLAVVAQAETLVNDATSTAAAIDDMIAELQDKLMTTTVDGDTTASEAILTHYVEAVCSELQDVYTADSLQAVKTALANKDHAKVVEALQALQTAAKVDRELLRVTIAIADAIDLDSYDTSNAAAAAKVLAAAKNVYADAARQDAVNAQQSELSKALQKVFEADSAIDTTELQEKLQGLIDQAEAIDLSNKTDASKKAFNKALAAAKAVLKDHKDDAEALEAAYFDLQTAMNGLQDKGNPDKEVVEKLEDLIEEADKIDTSFYTKESVEAFEKALAHAKAVLANEASTQAEIEAALAQLQAAKEGLKKNNLPPDRDGQDADNSGQTGDGKHPVTGGIVQSAAYAWMLVAAVGMVFIVRKRKASHE